MGIGDMCFKLRGRFTRRKASFSEDGGSEHTSLASTYTEEASPRIQQLLSNPEFQLPLRRAASQQLPPRPGRARTHQSSRIERLRQDPDMCLPKRVACGGQA